MKLIYAFIGLFLWTLASSQKKIPVSADTFVSINFPTSVESAKISIPDLVDVQTSEDNVFLQYLTSDEAETDKKGNMLVKTVDGYYYSFLIDYSASTPVELNYFINIVDALRRSSPIKKTLSDEKKIAADSKSTVKAQTVFSEISEKIVKNGGFIKSRNIIFNKKMSLILRGIYNDDSKLYFLFFVNNSSNIPYNVESYKFEILSTNDNESGVSQTVLPIDSYNKEILLKPNTENKMVFVFDQFTITDGKKLTLTVNEKKGDRSLIYDIDPKIFSSSRSVKSIK